MAEGKNAHAVIMVDTEANRNKNVGKLVMADENHMGRNIKIPSILINYNDGLKLIEAIQEREHGPIIAELVSFFCASACAIPIFLRQCADDTGIGWNIFSKNTQEWDIPVNDVVSMDLWYSAANREAHEFLKVPKKGERCLPPPQMKLPPAKAYISEK